MAKGLLASILMLASLGMSSQVFAQHDGNSLLRNCKLFIEFLDNQTREFGDGEWVDAGTCAGSMHGIIGTITYFGLWGEQSAICLPDGGISAGQTARIVVKYMEEHPGGLHLSGNLLALKALLETYPCE